METNTKLGSVWPKVGCAMANSLKKSLVLHSADDALFCDNNLRQCLWIIRHMRKRKLPFLYEREDMAYILDIFVKAFSEAAQAAFPDSAGLFEIKQH